MGENPETVRAPRLLLVAAVCLIAANMRASITGVGPLLEQMSADLGITIAILGALASIPLLAWGVISPLAHGLSERFGMSRVLLWSLVGLTLGTIWRSVPDNSALNLWLGTGLIGAAMAIANVLMPAVIKRDFPGRVPVVMSVFTALLAGVGAIASGIVVPLSHVEFGGDPLGWRGALLLTGILLPVAISAWGWTMLRGTREPIQPRTRGQRRPSTGVWKDPVAWQVAIYTGFQGVWFYILLAWIAPYVTAHGRSEVLAGVDVMVLQLAGIIGPLLLPLLLRGRMRRITPAILPIFAMIASLGLLLSPELVTLWVILTGLSSGSSFAMALTLMAERARTPSAAAALSGMAQSVGYLIAAAGPTVFGLLHAATDGWVIPFGLVIALMVAQVITGIVVGRERLVGDARNHHDSA